MADHLNLITHLKRIAAHAENDSLDLLDLTEIEGPVNDAIELLENSDIRPKAKPRGEQPEPAVGQIWRNRGSDRLVRIYKINRNYTHWSALTGRGQSRGYSIRRCWPTRFDYVETPEEGSNEA